MNDNRVLFLFEWFKGIKMNIPADNSLIHYLGYLIFSIATTILLFGLARVIKSIAPKGFYLAKRKKCKHIHDD